MASGNNQTTIDALLKEYYADGALVNETFKKNPLWAMMTKERQIANVTGRSFIHPVVFGASQGRSRTFSRSLARSRDVGELSVDFTVPRTKNTKVATIANETILSTMDSRGAFVKAASLVTDNSLRDLGKVQAVSMYGNQSDSIGQISSDTTLTTSTLKLSPLKAVLNFEVGMELDLAAAESSGAVKAYGSESHGLYVGAVDFNLGTITIVDAAGAPVDINDAAGGIPTAATGDYVFCRGDRNLGLAGLQAWLPYGGPSATPFMGVDRTVQPVRLAGSWLDATQLSLEDAFIEMTSRVEEVSNGAVTHIFLPFKQYNKLLKSQSAKVSIIDEVAPGVSFEGVEINTASGMVKVIPDRNCPANRMFGLDLESWSYTHVGDVVQIDDLDGKGSTLRQYDSDGVEIRFFSYGNLVCLEPANNIVAAVSP